jgi:hypothetical protein
VRRFGFERERALVEKPFSAPLRWQPYFAPTMELPPPPDTVVQGSIEVGEPSVTRQVEPIVNGIVCPSRIVAPATVEYATADGTVRGHAQGTFEVSEHGAHVFARGDLSETTGTLDLKIDETYPHVGLVGVYGASYPSGLRGSITPTVLYFASEEDAAAFVAADPEAPTPSVYAPFEGRWPVDHCSPSQMPVIGAEPMEMLGGSSFNELFAEAWQEALQSQPQAAIWNDGTASQISMELGEPNKICTSSVFNPTTTPIEASRGFQFEIEGALSTADGRVHTPVSWGLFAVTDSVTPAILSLEHSGQFVRAAEFEAAAGVAGANALGRPWLEASPSVNYVWGEQGLEPSGALAIYGVPSCDDVDEPCAYLEYTLQAVDCLYWPASAPPSYCLPPTAP